MLNRFQGMSFQSPPPSRPARAAAHLSPKHAGRVSLTPIIEEMSNLRVTSTPQHRKQDSLLRVHREELSVADLPSFQQSAEQFVQEEVLPRESRIEALRRAYNEELGEKGMRAWELQRKPREGPAPQNFAMTLISAISEDRVLANQFVEGGVDGSVYENFVYHLLQGIRRDPELRHRRVVLLMDNARIHHQELVVATALREHAYVLYSAEYSPWLNPVEWFFRHVKQQLQPVQVDTR